MGNLSRVIEDLKKELKRAPLEVQRPSAALAALGSSNSKGERTLSASARNNEDQLLSKGERVKDSKGIEASSGENNGLGTREAHLVSISPQEDRHLSKARWAKVKAGKKAAQVQARESSPLLQ
jgi:hypothetical protein